MLVSLEVGFQVVLDKPFVDLKMLGIRVMASEQPASPPRMDLPHRSVRLRAGGVILGQKTITNQRPHRPMICSKVVL